MTRKLLTRLLQPAVLIMVFIPPLVLGGGAFQHSDISRTLLEDLIYKINFQRFGWIGVQADVQLQFLTPENRTAACRGRLIYQRLEEKIVLECCNERDEVLFALKTLDTNFELYLPSQKTVFRGDIFDLEYSEKIDAQMKPLDLYRALKTMPFTVDQSVVDTLTRTAISVRIYRENSGKVTLSRFLNATRDGNVVSEIYYSTREEPVVAITRHNFDFIENARKETGRQVLFPKRILIESQKKPVKTELVLDKVRLLWNFPDDEWLSRIPPDTAVVDSEVWASENR